VHFHFPEKHFRNGCDDVIIFTLTVLCSTVFTLYATFGAYEPVGSIAERAGPCVATANPVLYLLLLWVPAVKATIYTEVVIRLISYPQKGDRLTFSNAALFGGSKLFLEENLPARTELWTRKIIRDVLSQRLQDVLFPIENHVPGRICIPGIRSQIQSSSSLIRIPVKDVVFERPALKQELFHRLFGNTKANQPGLKGSAEWDYVSSHR
jgi:hypothetical protein